MERSQKSVPVNSCERKLLGLRLSWPFLASPAASRPQLWRSVLVLLLTRSYCLVYRAGIEWRDGVEAPALEYRLLHCYYEWIHVSVRYLNSFTTFTPKKKGKGFRWAGTMVSCKLERFEFCVLKSDGEIQSNQTFIYSACVSCVIYSLQDNDTIFIEISWMHE